MRTHTEKRSEEATARGLELAKRQGTLFIEAARHMMQDVADTGDVKQVGDYIVGYALESQVQILL